MRKHASKAMRIWMLLAAYPVSSSAAAADIDCRKCHSGNDPKAKNYLHIYTTPEAHHPVEVAYPPIGKQSAYHVPTGQSGDIGFFDTNRNGIPDANEVQIFAGRMECASCHDSAHGEGIAPVAPYPHPLYLRMSNQNSMMCSVCHRL